jgi:hypothetical protein
VEDYTGIELGDAFKGSNALPTFFCFQSQAVNKTEQRISGDTVLRSVAPMPNGRKGRLYRIPRYAANAQQGNRRRPIRPHDPAGASLWPWDISPDTVEGIGILNALFLQKGRYCWTSELPIT